LGGRGPCAHTWILVWTLQLRRRRNLSIVTIEGMPKTHQVVVEVEVEVNMFFNLLVWS
jgi:hypothetical protein